MSIKPDSTPSDYLHFDGTADLGLAADDEWGCVLGVVVGLLLWLVLAVVLFLVVELLVPVVGVALFYVFGLALRRVFTLSDACRGQLLTSLGYAAFFTVLYTGWLFALLRVTDLLLSRGA